MRDSESPKKSGNNKTGNPTRTGAKAALLAAAMFVTAVGAFYFAAGVHAAKASARQAIARRPLASKSESIATPGATSSALSKPKANSNSTQKLAQKSFSLPLYFEPNQGQSDPQVKFLARGKGYGLFLTADEAVLQLQHSSVSTKPSAISHQPAPPAAGAVIRMHLDGANSAASVSGADPLAGKSNYFIGNVPANWRHDVPHFGRVEYSSVYPGINLVYYGDQGQLEYDFRVAPAADPNQIALSFQGASTRIDHGDLQLSTEQGDVRFHAPHIYQVQLQQNGSTQKSVTGSFRQLADNKIGFAIGAYDHSRELVIDPILSYSTYLGGTGTESFVNVAIDSVGLIYVAGSTTSANFPVAPPPAVAPIQANLAGTQNIFIAKINPSALPAQQLVYTTYLGGSGSEFAAGVAVSTDVDQFTTGVDIVVAGSTTSNDFPTAGALAPFQSTPIESGTHLHGFVSRINLGTTSSLRYSTYLSGFNTAGDAIDSVTGLAIDGQSDAFVTGTTTSIDNQSFGFPANPDALQLVSNATSQFFASKINTKGSGPQSMLYSTYFGGGNPQGGQTQGGGIAVDGAGNIYITGGTNFLPTMGPNPGEPAFPLTLAYQSCLDEAGKTVCTLPNPTALDAFIAKINTAPGQTAPVYCTYLGGSGDDIGFGIAVDSTNNAYITGSTTSSDWAVPTTAFQSASGGGVDAFIAKLGPLAGSAYPLNYFTYLGGSGSDKGTAIQVDSLLAAHVVGSTSSVNFPTTNFTYQTTNGGGLDAFVASIGTTLSGVGAGDFSTYLGGNGDDLATGVAIDGPGRFGATYVVGTTVSTDFPLKNPLQGALSGGSQDAFVSQIGASSTLTVTPSATSPTPNPVPAGTAVAFTFTITNTGPDTASQVSFTATSLPTTGLQASPTATVSTGGTCSLQTGGSAIVCPVGTLAAGSVSTVTVSMTPLISTTATQIAIGGFATTNNSGVSYNCNPAQPAAIISNFTVIATTSTPQIMAGDKAIINVVLKPTGSYTGSISLSQTILPSMVTANTPLFNPTSVTLSGTANGTTTLTIVTVARPPVSGSLLRRGSFYATWLPIGGLSLVGLGIGAGRKRRRWLVGIVLSLIAAAVLLQTGCGSSSSSAPIGGGTQANFYTITISASPGTGGARTAVVHLQVT